MSVTRLSGSRCNLLAWMCSAALLGAALLVYVLDPVSQRFETWPLLSGLFELATPFLPAVNIPFAIRFWLPDFAWAALAAMFAAEMLHAWSRSAYTGTARTVEPGPLKHGRLTDAAWSDQPGQAAGLLLIALVILLAACSWELLQGAGLVGGTFDVVDLAVSALAGFSVILVVGLHRFVFQVKECR